MNHFTYKALNEAGEEIRGIIAGPDAAAVHDKLMHQGLYVIKISASTRLFKVIVDKFASWQIKRRDVIEFASNLAIMLRAGIPLLMAIEDVMNTMTNLRMKAVVSEIKKNIEMGVSFSSALALYQNTFPDILIRLVKVGEETGRIDNSLAEVARHLQKVDDLAAAVKQALIYPIFSLFTTGGAVIFWLVYVLPKMMQIIVGMGVKMPLLTRILYQASGFSVRFWYIFPLIPVVLFILYQGMRLKPATRYLVDLCKIKCPFIRTLIYNKLLALLAEQMRLLITAGITIDRSLDIVADVMGNDVFRRAILQAKEEVMAGKKISESLAADPVFPRLFTRMMSIGEASGRMEQQFGYLAEHYYKIVDNFSQKIGKMIEPIFLIALGALMGTMIVGILLPMYDIFSKVAG